MTKRFWSFVWGEDLREDEADALPVEEVPCQKTGTHRQDVWNEKRKKTTVKTCGPPQMSQSQDVRSHVFVHMSVASRLRALLTETKVGSGDV